MKFSLLFIIFFFQVGFSQTDTASYQSISPSDIRFSNELIYDNYRANQDKKLIKNEENLIEYDKRAELDRKMAEIKNRIDSVSALGDSRFVNGASANDNTTNPSWTTRNYDIDNVSATNTNVGSDDSDNYNPYNSEDRDRDSDNKGNTFLKVVGIIFLWFIAGTIINFIFYNGVPDSQLGNNETAKAIHIIVNIITLILLFKVVFL